MKNIALIVAITIGLMLVSFDIPTQSDIARGNGHVITTNRAVTPFSQISIDGVFNIYLIQGNEEMVKVETDENLQDYVTVKVKDDKLIIRTKEDEELKKSTRNNIYVTLKDIYKMEINSVGKIECKNVLSLEKLTLIYNGVGKTVLKLDCGQFNTEIASVGSLIIMGKSKSANINHSGVGSVSAYDFKVDYLSLDHSGVGSVEAYASKEISIASSGIGSVRYKGPAEVMKLNIAGIGSVKRAD